MKLPALFGLTAFALTACTAEQAPLPTLPPGVATTNLTVVDDSYLRGVNGSSNTVPPGRSAAILDVTYSLTCIADGAQARAAEARQILDTTYVVAPLFITNPRERNGWRTTAARAVDGTGCIVTGLTYTSRTTDVLETGMWALRNGVGPA